MKKLSVFLTIVLFACSASAFDGGETLYEFTFDSDFDGFVVQSAISGVSWLHSDKYVYGLLRGSFPHREGGFIIIDSEDLGRVPLDASVQSPALRLDVQPGDLFILQFDHSFKHLGAEKARIEISTDNGLEWNTVREYSGRTLFGQDIVPLNGVVNEETETLIVRFHYFDANYAWFWSLDNIRLIKIPDADIVEKLFYSNSDFSTDVVLNLPDIPSADNACYGVNCELVLINHGLSEDEVEMVFSAGFDYLPGNPSLTENYTGFYDADKEMLSVAPGHLDSITMKWNNENYYVRSGGGVFRIKILNQSNRQNLLLSNYLITRYLQKEISDL